MLSILCLILFITGDISSFELSCPGTAQWHLYAKGFCSAQLPSYVCLHDEIHGKIVETCEKKPEFDWPGYRLLIRGGYEGERCSKTTYQPIKFLTDGNSRCVFLKSKCEDEGQIYSDFGSTVTDVSCRCDNTQGYAFVTMPTNSSACYPSYEDCSCYFKVCAEFMVLAEDYSCRKMNEKEANINRQCFKGNRSNSYANERRTTKEEHPSEDTATTYHGDRLLEITMFSMVLLVIIGIISLMVVTVKRPQSVHNTKITPPGRCNSCSNLTVCAFCNDCKTYWCQDCCKRHMERAGHSIVEIDKPRIQPCEANVICSKCKDCAVHHCGDCAEFFCSNCHCQHFTGNLFNIVPRQKSKRFKRIMGEFPKEVRIPLVSEFNLPNRYKKPVCVCGISVLSDRRIVIADSNNNQLILFNDSHWEAEQRLKYEPTGMASLFYDRIAITIAELQIIRIYDIVLDENYTTNFKELKEKGISTSKVGRPYKIAYNGDHFVVEIYTSEREVLVVYNSDGVIIKVINITSKLIRFPGKIRLCLQWDRRLIYVSAIDTKKVVCLDFEGKEKWEQHVSSPRSIIFVHDGKSKNLLSACSCFDTLYRMRGEDGSYDKIRLPERVTSPNFLAYNIEHKLLIVMGCRVIYTCKYNIEN